MTEAGDPRRYDGVLFVVIRAASYVDALEEVAFGELHIFVGPNFVITVRHSESPDLSHVRRRMEDDPELLGFGTQAILYAIIDAVVDGYAPVVAGLANDVDEIETEVFNGDAPECPFRTSAPRLADALVRNGHCHRRSVDIPHVFISTSRQLGWREQENDARVVH